MDTETQARMIRIAAAHGFEARPDGTRGGVSLAIDFVAPDGTTGIEWTWARDMRELRAALGY